MVCCKFDHLFWWLSSVSTHLLEIPHCRVIWRVGTIAWMLFSNPETLMFYFFIESCAANRHLMTRNQKWWWNLGSQDQRLGSSNQRNKGIRLPLARLEGMHSNRGFPGPNFLDFSNWVWIIKMFIPWRMFFLLKVDLGGQRRFFDYWHLLNLFQTFWGMLRFASLGGLEFGR